MTAVLTAEDRATIKAAAFGAVFLVCNAEPGVLDLVRESFAASDAIAGTTGLVREVLTTGPLPAMANSRPADVADATLPALRRAVAILTEKSPETLDDYRAAVLGAATEAAAASGDVSPAEVAVLRTVREALGLPGEADQAGPSAGRHG